MENTKVKLWFRMAVNHIRQMRYRVNAEIYPDDLTTIWDIYRGCGLCTYEADTTAVIDFDWPLIPGNLMPICYECRLLWRKKFIQNSIIDAYSMNLITSDDLIRISQNSIKISPELRILWRELLASYSH